VRQKAGKLVHAWAIEADCEPAQLRSNSFSMEWPPRSGRMAEFPEVDRGAWFALDEARAKLLEAQHPLLDALQALL
jgi:predicted NUDIX family NTP pyrophosphohydrolase